VDPSTSVKQIIATHWHDDHIKGLTQTLEACSSAEFVCSGALSEVEFLTLVMAVGQRSLMTTSGVNEFYQIIKVLENRVSSAPTPLKFASADKRLLYGTFPCWGAEVPYELHALSPSDSSILLAHQRIAELLPEERAPKRRVPALRPNHAAVVLLLRLWNSYVLLGSDLEDNREQGGGWSAILASTGRPPARAEVFKVPHHGSVNADHPGVWTEMLEANPYALLSPFLLGDVLLPSREDVARLRERTRRGYLTAPPRRKPLERRPNIVERELRGFVRNRRRLDAPFGQVRLRAAPQDEGFSWSVELDGAAIPLEKAYLN
jgi:hypothetical protein